VAGCLLRLVCFHIMASQPLHRRPEMTQVLAWSQCADTGQQPCGPATVSNTCSTTPLLLQPVS
jgi:hypothetical protein